jgi:hypothetical protein
MKWDFAFAWVLIPLCGETVGKVCLRNDQSFGVQNTNVLLLIPQDIAK